MKPDEIYQFIQQREIALAEAIRSKGIDLESTSPFRYCASRQSLTSPTLILNSPAEEKPSIDEEGFKATFVITTPTFDRYGDSVVPKGCIPHLKAYRRNPRVFFCHRTNELPVGSCRTPLGELALQFFEDKILGTVQFHEETQESRTVARLVFRKELEAASIGFLPVKASPFEPSKTTDRPEEDNDGDPIIYFREDPMFRPLKFHEWEMLEWSIVPLPGNSECLANHLSRGSVEGEQITPLLRKALEPYAAKRKVTMGYIPPTEEQITAAVEEIAQKEQELIPTEEVSPIKGFSLNDEKRFLMKDGEAYVTYEVLEALNPAVFQVKDGEMLKYTSAEGFTVVKDMGLDNLIGPPETPMEEDKEKDWPLGAKFLSRAIKSYGETCAWMTEMDKQLDQPRVKKLAMKKMAKLNKLSHAAVKLGSQLYPDKFSYEETPQEKSIREEKKKEIALNAEALKEMEAKIMEEKERAKSEEEALVKAVSALVDAQKNTQKLLFELTGRK